WPARDRADQYKNEQNNKDRSKHSRAPSLAVRGRPQPWLPEFLRNNVSLAARFPSCSARLICRIASGAPWRACSVQTGRDKVPSGNQFQEPENSAVRGGTGGPDIELGARARDQVRGTDGFDRRR